MCPQAQGFPHAVPGGEWTDRLQPWRLTEARRQLSLRAPWQSQC